MPCYIALLRAINVGGHTVKMDRLRTLFTSFGFSEVETFIASGNVIFVSQNDDPSAVEDSLEERLMEDLGYPVGVYLRTAEEIASIAAFRPFDEPAGRTLSVIFLKDPPVDEVHLQLAALDSDTDRFRIRAREIYWLTDQGISRSAAAPLLGKALGGAGTLRNVTTVRRLAERYGSRK